MKLSVEPYYSSLPPLEVARAMTTPRAARLYFEWFISTKEDRVEHLFKLLGLPSGGTREEVFLTAGEWMNSHELTEAVAPAALTEFREAMEGHMDFAPKWQLTGDVLRLCLDLGRYFGDQLILAAPGVEWQVWLKNRRDFDYGRPVVMRDGGVPTNPFRVCTVCANFAASGKDAGIELREGFDANLERVVRKPMARIKE